MKKQIMTIKPIAVAVATMGLFLTTPASAFKLDFDNGLQGSFDSTISFGMQRRMQSPDGSIIGVDSGGSTSTTSPAWVSTLPAGSSAFADFNYAQTDDGTLNYKKGDIVSAVLKGTHELFIKDPGNWSALARATWSSDFRADKTRRTPLDPEAKDAMTQNVSILDLWVAKDFSLGDQSAKIKFGNQVMSWGEDIFILGGINSINALDLRKYHIPGTQLKEIFIPAPMVSLSAGLGNGFSTEAYYQFNWNKFAFDPSGTYWSAADFLGKGGKRGAFIPTSYATAFGKTGNFGDFDPTRGRTIDSIKADLGYIPIEQTSPKNTGQFGINFRFKPQEGDTEYAAYFVRYHDKIPFVGWRKESTPFNWFQLGATAPGVTAVEQYGENRSLFGLSMNTKVGDWAIGAEISYRPKDSVAIDPTVPISGQYSVLDPSVPVGGLVNGYKEEKKWQAHVTGFRLFPAAISSALGAAEGFFLGEIAVTHYPKLDLSGNVPYLLNNYALPDKTSWGYVAEFGLTYADIFKSGWTMSPILDIFHDVKGTTPNALPFVEGRKAVNLGLNFDYHNQWKANVSYTTFFGGGNLNMMRDRDVMSASLSYTF